MSDRSVNESVNQPSVERRSSGGPWEDSVGYSRVVRAGELAWVAGSTSMVNGELVGEGDAFRQTIEAFGVAAVALESVGMSLRDAVRTRMSIVDRALARDVCRAHFEIFDAIRPVSTLVVVAGLVDERMLVEVEVDACRPDSAPGSRRYPGQGAGALRRDRP